VDENSLVIRRVEPKIDVNWKHGSPSRLATKLGRKSGTFEITMPLAPSGTHGTAPESDIIWQGVFGGGGGQVTDPVFGTAYQYGFTNFASVPFGLFGFAHGLPSTGNEYALGCIPQQVTITYNGSLLSARVSGVCVAVVQNETFSVQDTVAQAGLSVFPVEPGAFAFLGDLINGFDATLFVGGTPVSGMCDGFTLTINTGLGLKGDFVDDPYPAQVTFGRRLVTCSVQFENNDSSILTTLKQDASQNTPTTIGFYLGTVVGLRQYAIINNVQFIAAELTDASDFVTCNFGSAGATVSPGGSNDVLFGFA
jgi:hypothetical protein